MKDKEDKAVCYTVEEFAKLLKYSPHGIRDLIHKGKIRAAKMNDGIKSPFRIPVSELYRFLGKGICQLNPSLKQVEEEI